MPRAGTEVCIKWRSTFLRCHAGLNPLPRSISSLSLAYFITPSFNAQLAPPPLVPFSHRSNCYYREIVQIVDNCRQIRQLFLVLTLPMRIISRLLTTFYTLGSLRESQSSLLLSCLVSKGEKPISSCGNLIKVKEGNRDRESPNTGGNKSGDV